MGTPAPEEQSQDYPAGPFRRAGDFAVTTRGDPHKPRIAGVLRSTTTVALQWLAEQLSMRTAANILHACCRHDADSRLCSFDSRAMAEPRPQATAVGGATLYEWNFGQAKFSPASKPNTVTWSVWKLDFWNCRHNLSICRTT